MPYGKNEVVHFTALASHATFSLNCQVFSTADANNNSKVIAQTGALTLRTTRSFLVSFFRVVGFLLLVAWRPSARFSSCSTAPSVRGESGWLLSS